MPSVIRVLGILAFIFIETGISEETASNAKPKIVCYFTNWAGGRKDRGSFTPKNVDPNLCTHINYAFAVLDAKNYAIVPYNENVDKEYYKQMTTLKSKSDVKVLISLGGVTDSSTDKYSKLVSSKSNRDKFIKQAIDYIIENNFDGIDLDWEFPKCWNSDCTKGPDSDKPNFVKLLSELRTALDEKRKGLLLTLATSGNKKVIDQAYDLPSIAKYCDFINVMTYDYHGGWCPTTGITAPLNDVKNTIQYYLDKKFPASKLVLGLSLFGASFTLKSTSNNGLGAPASTVGEAGEYTGEPGELAFYEIVNHVRKDNWRVVRKKNVGSYAYSGNQWVGYDDLQDAAVKARYIVQKKLAGAMVWALDFDVFYDESCHGRKYPMTSTVKDILNGKKIRVKNCGTETISQSHGIMDFIFRIVIRRILPW